VSVAAVLTVRQAAGVTSTPVCAGTGMNVSPGCANTSAGSGIQGALVGGAGAKSLIIMDSSSSRDTWSDWAPPSTLLNSERASNLRGGAAEGGEGGVQVSGTGNLAARGQGRRLFGSAYVHVLTDSTALCDARKRNMAHHAVAGSWEP
jgi:hypothetical protein